MRLHRPDSTLPAPSSTKLSTPIAVIASTLSRQRTVDVTWRTSSSRIWSGALTLAAVTLATSGSAGTMISASPRASRIASAAGAISEQWNGAETGSSMARRMPRSLASSIARATALSAPEITTWPPPLSLATSITSRASGRPSMRSSAAAAQIWCACSTSTPSSAAMPPSPDGTACCMAAPRRRSSPAVRAMPRLPAAARAAYSPSEWPATTAALPVSCSPPSCSSTRSTASETAISAGWVFWVSVSSSIGPANISLDRRSPSASSTSWNTSRAGAKAAARSRPMPANWLPCPGKMKA